MTRFAGNVALVTGTTSGMGRDAHRGGIGKALRGRAFMR